MSDYKCPNHVAVAVREYVTYKVSSCMVDALLGGDYDMLYEKFRREDEDDEVLAYHMVGDLLEEVQLDLGSMKNDFRLYHDDVQFCQFFAHYL